MDNLPVDPSTAQKTPDLPSPFLHPTSSAQPLPSAVHPAPADLTLPSTSSETANILSSSQPASFGSSPPLPPLPPQEQRISLSESLAQLQGEAAFVPRPPQPPAQPQAVAGGVLAEPGQPKRAIDESVEFYISGLTARELFVRLPEVRSRLPPPQKRRPPCSSLSTTPFRLFSNNTSNLKTARNVT